MPRLLHRDRRGRSVRLLESSARRPDSGCREMEFPCTCEGNLISVFQQRPKSIGWLRSKASSRVATNELSQDLVSGDGNAGVNLERHSTIVRGSTTHGTPSSWSRTPTNALTSFGLKNGSILGQSCENEMKVPEPIF